MGPNRVFFPQEALDGWLLEGKVELEGNVLVVKDQGRRYRVVEAVRVLSEVTGQPDSEDLVGRVKTVGFLQALGAELLGGSLVLGEQAYEVVPGWMGTPIGSFAQHRADVGPSGTAGSDEELLERYLLQAL